MSYQIENDKLLKSFLDRTFFRKWKNGDSKELENFSRMEIYLSAECNLACKYCYLARSGSKLFPETSSKTILKNTGMFIDWLIENEYTPDIDFFSGDPLTQKVGFDALHLILDRFSQVEKRPRFIVIPTNYTFLLSDKLTTKVESLLEKGQRLGIIVLLSASFDGKYCEKNRPFKSRDECRDEAYYDKCFEFSVKHRFGFHPMVYSGLIEKWIDNFLWFQEKFKQFKIKPDNIYLLEVRNVEWSNKQTKDYMKFIEFIIEWAYKEFCKESLDNYINFVFRWRGFNILSNCLGTVGRGIGCSIQAETYIRMADLTIVPCHRTAYESNVIGKFIIKNDKIVGLKAFNPELMIGIMSFNQKSQPQCEACIIKYICQGQCLGSMYEVTGDLFSPIPSVCRLFHAKIAAMINVYKRLGIYQPILNKMSWEKQVSFRLMENLMKKEIL